MTTAIPTIHIHCPCGHDMIRGPRGGASQNFYCTDRAGCRKGWNLTIREDCEIVFMEPIGAVDDERYQMYLNKTAAKTT